MTGTIKSAVSHQELEDAVEELEGKLTDAEDAIGEQIDAVAECECIDVSEVVPLYTSNLERYMPNGCVLHRYGKMVSLSVCFVVQTAVAAGNYIFGFPPGYTPRGPVFAIMGNSAGNAIPFYYEEYNGTPAMKNQAQLPVGVFRTVLTYVMADTQAAS